MPSYALNAKNQRNFNFGTYVILIDILIEIFFAEEQHYYIQKNKCVLVFVLNKEQNDFYYFSFS